MAESQEKVEKSSASKAEKHPSDTSRGKELSSDGRSGCEVEKHPSVASRNEGSVEDLNENFERLDITETLTAPEQTRVSSVASKETEVKRRLSYGESIEENKSRCEEPNSEEPIGKDANLEQSNGNETPQQKSDSSIEREDGEWLEGHSWSSAEPDLKIKMEKTVNASKVYTVPEKWLKDGKVNLEQIYLYLPEFIDEMKGSSIRRELEDVLNSKSLEEVRQTPHVLEILQKKENILPKDKKARRKPDGNNYFKAFSLEDLPRPSEERWFLDCEYMLTMHLPDDSLKWFNKDDQHEKRIREINAEKKEKRWVFIPSFRRAQIALLEWPEDEIVTKESTIRILVVRPSEFAEYVQYCGHKFPIICLPQDEIGAGYPRYWIQKIALRLELQFIWMIDDSVECFYEYHPKKHSPKREDGTQNFEDYRRRTFGLVFKRIEELVKATKEPIAAMSPKRFMGSTRLMKPFVCKPPRIAVFLNLEALKSTKVYYRPELKTFEDMIFGYECEKNGLKVFMDNRIHVQDHNNWHDTGARSPSVQQKPT